MIDHITLAYSKGLCFAAYMGERTWAQQDALYAQGRTKPGKKVTNAPAGTSAHNYGLAVDEVEDGDPNNAGIQWSWASTKDFITLGGLAKQCGLEWGGLWKSFKDYPHVSLTMGLTIAQAKALYLKGGKQAVWDEIDRRLKAGMPIGSGW